MLYIEGKILEDLRNVVGSNPVRRHFGAGCMSAGNDDILPSGRILGNSMYLGVVLVKRFLARGGEGTFTLLILSN